jgi:tetratricopeptide (TPR) repeat protein
LLALSIRSSKRKKLLAAIALAAALACLLFTETRSAWIGFAFSLLLFAVLVVKTRITRISLKMMILPSIVLVLALFLLFLSQDVILKRISQIGDPYGSFLTRIHIWEATGDMIKASPIFGSGLGTFQIVFPRFKYPGFHSEYLEIWAEMGLLGLATFLWLIVAFLRHVLKNLKHKPEGILVVGLVSGIAGVLVDSLFSASLRWTGPAFTFWLLFSLAVVMVRSREAFLEKGDRKPRNKLVRLAVVSVALACIVLIAKWHIDKYKVNVYVGRALALLDGESRRQGISEFRKAQDKDPESPVAPYMLGCLNIEEGDFQEAKRWFEKLEPLAPDFANSHEWKGYLFFRLGDLHEAEKEFKICTYVKSSVFNHNMLGRIYSLQEKWDQAIEEFEESCRLGARVSDSPVDVSAFLPAGESVEGSFGKSAGPAVGGFGGSEEDETINAHIMLGRIYYEKQEYAKSIEHLEKLQEDRLNDKQIDRVAQLYNNIAWDYARQAKNLANALELCERALNLSPSRPELIHDTQAWIHFKTGDFEQAKTEVEAALSAAPENETIKEHLLIIERALKGELRDIDMQEIRQR